jgi:hypothetical protein
MRCAPPIVSRSTQESGVDEHQTSPAKPLPGLSIWEIRPQLPAALNWLTTSCGILPRFDSSIPLASAQRGTARLSMPELALRLVERFPLTLRALLT